MPQVTWHPPCVTQAEMDQYADCFIDAEKLPEREIRSALAVVTGSLGLSFPRTAEAMRRAVKIAKDAGVTVGSQRFRSAQRRAFTRMRLRSGLWLQQTAAAASSLHPHSMVSKRRQELLASDIRTAATWCFFTRHFSQHPFVRVPCWAHSAYIPHDTHL